MVLIMLGAFTKSAQVPFYIWLPDAMEAPTPVSAYLHSATMVKAGLYLVARVTRFCDITRMDLDNYFSWSNHAFLGIFKCHKTTRFERYTCLLNSISTWHDYVDVRYWCRKLSFRGSQSQLYIAGFTAAVFHLVNHATFKGALFMITGAVDHVTGTRDVKNLVVY